MDGLEATSVIRRRWSAEQLPVIALTAHAMAEERERCLAAGMNQHLSKPLRTAELAEALRRWGRRGAGSGVQR
jgi:CheY-like chemotaxis protein